MRIAQQFRRAALHQPFFYRPRGLAWRQAGAVPQAKNMRIHGHGILPKGHIQNDIGGFPPNAGQVPDDRAALEALPGVGRKTANVVLNVAFGQNTMAVSYTHLTLPTKRIV